MDRGKNDIATLQRKVHVLGSLVRRLSLAGSIGQEQYGGDRDIYQALGYPTTISYQKYLDKYERHDIAKAIIDRPVRATWQGALQLIETNEPEDTEFESQWKNINRKLGLKSILARVDRLAGIGKYGVLVLGLDDVKEPSQLEKPVTKGKRVLWYVKPFGEESAKIGDFEENSKSVRYGLPLIYEVQLMDKANQSSMSVRIHHTRVIHIVEDNLESEVEGYPKLQSVYNRLLDLDKIVGGDGEMFWRGARPGFHGKLDKDYQITQTTKDDLIAQVDEYEHNLRRILINEGIDLEALAQQLADPTSHVQVQLQMISAVTGIPVRILTGSERGELASSEDRGEWLSYVQARREEHAEPHIVRPFVDRLIEYAILPKPSVDYSIRWADLYSLSEKARVEIGKARANSIREYTTNPIASGLMTPSVFMELGLGLTPEQIEWAHAMRDKEMDEEIKELARIKEELEPEAPVVGSPKKKETPPNKGKSGEPRKLPKRTY